MWKPISMAVEDIQRTERGPGGRNNSLEELSCGLNRDAYTKERRRFALSPYSGTREPADARLRTRTPRATSVVVPIFGTFNVPNIGS